MRRKWVKNNSRNIMKILTIDWLFWPKSEKTLGLYIIWKLCFRNPINDFEHSSDCFLSFWNSFITVILIMYNSKYHIYWCLKFIWILYLYIVWYPDSRKQDHWSDIFVVLRNNHYLKENKCNMMFWLWEEELLDSVLRLKSNKCKHNMIDLYRSVLLKKELK